MPIYEYHCEECDKDVELFFLSFSDASEETPKCPECGGLKLERMISSVAVVKEESYSETPSPGKRQQPYVEDTKALSDAMKKAQRGSKGGYGDDFKEVAGRLERGESSESIEKKLRDRVGEKMGAH